MSEEIPTPSSLKAGATLIKKYQILEELTPGGMGGVSKAKRLTDGIIVAIKWCRLHGGDWRRRFIREVNLMRSIKHANELPILNYNHKHNPPYFVMPFADGSVGHVLDEYAADEARALKDFLQICLGVQAIHNAGAVHRDIKPDNALFLKGRVVVADLGLAKLSDRDTTILTQTVAIVGTQRYLAPEQRMPGGSRDADRRTDIYQLGKTLYQMLTALDPLLVDLDKVSAGLGRIIRKATQEHPSKRYQSVGELIDAIKLYQQAKDPHSNPMAVFEATLSIVKDRLERHEFREADIQKLLTVLNLEDVRKAPPQFLELFDQMPGTILHVCAEQFEDEFLPVLEAYVAAIDDQVSGENFSYAETITSKMKSVFGAPSATPQMKSLAIEAALLGAVRLNRFAALDVVNAMLPQVDDDDDAFEIAEMLRRRKHEYERIYDAVPALKLHPALRAVQKELTKSKDVE